MRFSWRGLLIAPLLAPGIFGAVIAALLGGDRPLSLFLLSFVLASIISYSVTIFVFLPSLYLLSRVGSATGPVTHVLGFVLGTTAYIPWTWIEWGSSGPDSGPPTESFLSFLLRWTPDPLCLIFPVAGLVTAALYWAFGTRRQRRGVA